MKKSLILSFACMMAFVQVHSQCGISLTLGYDLPLVCGTLPLTMKEDALGRDYLYVANKESGLTIWSLTGMPMQVHQVPVSDFDSLQVMNVSQSGNYLYLAIGNLHGSDTQPGGIAIVDVSNPLTAFVTDYWVDTLSTLGAAIVQTEGNYAYLGGLDRGLSILDISNKSDIVFKSRFSPSTSFPPMSPFVPGRFNARGLAVRDGIVYLCFDGGGLRIVNATDPMAPFETGRHSLPLPDTTYRFYNNIVLQDSLAYIAVDHCGMEIVNIADTSNLTLVGWWNPWGCGPDDASWVNSPGYANEISLDNTCHRVFLSTGRNDLMVVDVSNPAAPDSCDSWGNRTDLYATWGMSATPEHVYLGYICSAIPFFSLWSGIRILNIGDVCAVGRDEPLMREWKLSPNPTTGSVMLPAGIALSGEEIVVSVLDVTGKVCSQERVRWNDEGRELVLPEAAGVYVVMLEKEGGRVFTRVVRN